MFTYRPVWTLRAFYLAEAKANRSVYSFAYSQFHEWVDTSQLGFTGIPV